MKTSLPAVLFTAAALTLAALPSLLNAGTVLPPVEVKDDPASPQVHVTFRLDQALDAIKSASLMADGTEVPGAAFTPFNKLQDSSVACAWVIDYRAESAFTTRMTKNFCRTTVTELVKNSDASIHTAVYTFAKDLKEVSRYDAPRSQVPADFDNNFLIRPELAGTSNIVAASTAALAKLQGQDAQRRFLVLFTDGDDAGRASPLSWEPAYKALTDAATGEKKVPIYVVAFEQTRAKKEKNYPWMKELAAKTGGMFIEVGVVNERPEFGDLVKILPSFTNGGRVSFARDLLKDKKKWQVKVQTVSSQSFLVPDAQVAVVAPATPPSNGQPNNGQPNNGQPNNGQPNNGQPNNGQPNNGQPNNGQPNNGQANNGQTNNGQTNAQTKTADPAKTDYTKWLMFGLPALLLVVLAFALLGGKKKVEVPEPFDPLAAGDDGQVAPQFRDQDVGYASPVSLAPTLAWFDMLDADATRHNLTSTNIRVGRGKDNDFVIANKSVSSNHCVIKRSRDGIWSVVDLNSGNGVYINDKRVDQSALQDGDVLELGEVKMRFRIA